MTSEFYLCIACIHIYRLISLLLYYYYLYILNMNCTYFLVVTFMHFNKLVPTVVVFSDLRDRDSHLGYLGDPCVSPPPGSEVVCGYLIVNFWLPV